MCEKNEDVSCLVIPKKSHKSGMEIYDCSVCRVCCERFSSEKDSIRVQLLCEHCNFSACMSCIQRYMLETRTDPQCMNCHKVWTQTFLNKLQTKFIETEYKAHRKSILLEREKSLLPDSQTEANKFLQKRKLNNEMKKLHVQLENVLCEIENMKFRRLKFIRNKVDIEVKIKELHNTFKGIDKKDSKKEIIRRSCILSTCRGFIGEDWKCGMCSIEICKHCHHQVTQDTPHTCNQIHVETAKLLMTNTKPCPVCTTFIYKIDGCDQMYCTKCNNAIFMEYRKDN